MIMMRGLPLCLVKKKLHVNIPFIDALSQMSNKILSKKRKIEEHETKALGEEYSSMVLNKLSTELKDPGSFSIP